MTKNLILFLSTAVVIGLSPPAQAQTYDLTKEDVEFLRHIGTKDKLIRELPNGVRALDALNKVFGIAVTGPVKVVVQWNKGTIQAWRNANRAIERIGKAKICEEIQLHTVLNDQNRAFFDDLYDARGCNEQ